MAVPRSAAPAVLSVLLALGCNRDGGAERRSSPEKAAATTDAEDQPVGYPPARWRLRPSLTNDVLLSVQHILVAHRDSDPARAGMWSPEAPPKRTRQQALKRALGLAKRARAEPGKFAEAAKENSDDAVTAPWGGACGLVLAPQLPDEWLDAMDQLRPGQVSRVIESAWGFHVLKRLRVPPERWLSGRAIVIKYRGASGWQRQDRPVESRTRAQAMARARDVARRAREAPHSFATLVQEWTDGYDPAAGGDLGPHSTYEGSSAALVLHVLGQLKVGAVSDPVDTREGIVVLQRTDDVKRPWLAASEIAIGWKDAPGWPTKPRPARDQQEALALATDLARRLSVQPDEFVEAQRQHCDLPNCASPALHWMRGRGLPPIERAVEALDVGGVTAKPVQTPMGFHILRRERAVARQIKPDVRFELPRPEPRSLEEIVSRLSPQALQRGTQRFAADFEDQLGLEPDQGEQARAIFRNFAAQASTLDASQRVALLREAKRELKALIGAERFAAYQRFERNWLLDTQFH